ncbi:hypothetical protein ARMGADRAFT_1084566 [Armillaria gallica]|uniref:Uncharacterized protein n=1 Tax=Armillaria gallica TaxID=47427 RepID=A0A2H3DCK1_ARMGA|nr:hypothetical protein ARMGADRAFT_1084566 [Armillaria gallica]
MSSAERMTDEGEERSDATKSLDGNTVSTIVLPPFPKGWVKGSHLPFFESFQIPFAYHRSQSVTPAKEFVDTITNQYLHIYWWDLPVDKEPTSVPEPPHLEVLTAERKALKATKISIYNWLDYQWKHLKSGPAPLLANQCNPKSADPFHLLLCNSDGPRIITGPSRKTWMSNWKEKDGLFAALPAEEQKKYESLAKEEGNVAREVKHRAIKSAGELLTPTKAQKSLDHLAATMGLFLKKMASMLGLHVALYIAGPEPHKGGQINVLSLHAGFDKSPVPLEYPDSVETCYTEEEKLARSLPPDELARDTDVWKPFNSTDSMDVDDCDEMEEKQPKKKKKQMMKKSVRKKTPGKKKDKKKKVGAKDAEVEGLDNAQACPPHQPLHDVVNGQLASPPGAKKVGKKKDGEKDNNNQGPDNAQARLHPKPLHNVAIQSGTASTPFLLANINSALLLKSGILGGPDIIYHVLEDGPIAHQSINGSYGSVAPITGPNDNSHPFTVPDEHPDTILFRSSPINEIGEIPPPHGSITPEEDLPPDVLLLQRESWKLWYTQIRKMFNTIELPSQWSMVMMYLTLLEGWNTFEKGTTKDSPTAEGQPKWLSHWVQCGRKAVPHKVMPDLTSIGEEWWVFWKGLQPVWHDIRGIKGLLSASHRGDIVGEKEWGKLNKRGVNSIITAMAGLAF